MIRKTLFVITAIWASGHIHAQDVPDVSVFIPAPPAESTLKFANDYLQYTWGRSVRESMGTQSASDMNPSVSTYLSAFSKVVGMDLSATHTPRVAYMFEAALSYGKKAVAKAQAAYPRYERPYVRFHEATTTSSYESTNRDVSSFPSLQATMGWLYAMLLTEFCPAKQDQILARGYAFGTSSVISGYNWYSDAYAGQLLASALLPKMRVAPEFNVIISAAKAEFQQKAGVRPAVATTRNGSGTYIAMADLPNAVNYLPAPPDTLSAQFAYDINQYLLGLNLEANSEEVNMAIADVVYSTSYFCKIFGEVMGRTVDAASTPQTYELIRRVTSSGDEGTRQAKAYYRRVRPFDRFEKATLYGPEEEAGRKRDSYPSGHSSAAWLIAMIFSELSADDTEALLSRAYLYGQRRIIAGYHWQSDVDMGRLVAGAIYASLHANTDFLRQLELAKKELGTATAIRSIAGDETAKDIYTLQGIRLDSQPSRHGIYIQGNRKVAY